LIKIKGKTVSISGLERGLGSSFKVNDLGGKVVTILVLTDIFMTKKEFLVINRFYARNESKR
jgi:hypothetical protein